MNSIILMLFIINLGVGFGAGIYETRIVIPMWFKKSPDTGYYIDTQTMRDMDVGRKFWGMITTMPLTLLTLASLYLSWQPSAPAYQWWFAAALIILCERIGTFAFFIPNAIKLGKIEGQSAAASRLASLWINVNYLRLLLTLLGWLAALQALAVGI